MPICGRGSRSNIGRSYSRLAVTPSMAACSARKPRVQLGMASACIAALASIGPATANTYHNEAFGVSVEIPGRMRTCRTSPPTPDRGFTILPLHGGCDDGDAPRISLSLSYNASLEHRTTREVARDWCGPMPAKWAAVAADGVRLMECAPGGRVPGRGVGAVGKSPAVATAESLAEAGDLSTAVVTVAVLGRVGLRDTTLTQGPPR